MRHEMDRELNYAHNTIADLRADTYAFLCQQGCAMLCSDSKGMIKFQSIMFGLNAIKVHSKLSDNEEKISTIINSMIEELKTTSEICLTTREIEELLLLCGSIENRNNIPKFRELLDKINKERR